MPFFWLKLGVSEGLSEHYFSGQFRWLVEGISITSSAALASAKEKLREAKDKLAV